MLLLLPLADGYAVVVQVLSMFTYRLHCFLAPEAVGRGHHVHSLQHIGPALQVGKAAGKAADAAGQAKSLGKEATRKGLE